MKGGTVAANSGADGIVYVYWSDVGMGRRPDAVVVTDGPWDGSPFGTIVDIKPVLWSVTDTAFGVRFASLKNGNYYTNALYAFHWMAVWS